MEEIEAKFLNIDPKKMEDTLLSLGAVKKYDRVFRDRVFDFPGFTLNAQSSWLRLRDKGDKITLSFKRRLKAISGQNDLGMEETEIIVNDFEQTTVLLEKLGMIQKFNEEKRRIHFELNEVEIDIDTWPLLESYLEIEGKSWDIVKETAGKLGLNWEDKKIMPAWEVYKLNGITEMDYSILTFDKQIKRQ